MTYVDIVTALALLQFMVFGFKVARARGRYGIAAPAIAGNETFERYFRVQQNTLEQLIIFLPALYVFSHSYSPLVAAVLGVVYLIGREVYAITYVKDPKKRELGFLLTVLPTAILIFGGLVGAIRQLK
jgi:glutathione S-transferase